MSGTTLMAESTRRVRFTRRLKRAVLVRIRCARIRLRLWRIRRILRSVTWENDMTTHWTALPDGPMTP